MALRNKETEESKEALEIKNLLKKDSAELEGSTETKESEKETGNRKSMKKDKRKKVEFGEKIVVWEREVPLDQNERGDCKIDKEFRTPNPKKLNKIFLFSESKNCSKNSFDDIEDDSNYITPCFTPKFDRKKRMKRKASEFERQDRSNCFTNLFPSFYNSCKIQKTTEENDFEDIDFTNVNEFKNIRTPILRKRALSDCKSMFSYPQLKRNTTKFIISQHKNCGLIHPSTCAFEARPENDEDECEISDPSESCASMVGLVTADLF